MECFYLSHPRFIVQTNISGVCLDFLYLLSTTALNIEFIQMYWPKQIIFIVCPCFKCSKSFWFYLNRFHILTYVYCKFEAHYLTSSIELGSGVQHVNSSRAISAEVFLSRARAWRVFSAQCSSSTARQNSARVTRRRSSRRMAASDSPWLWQGRKHQHKNTNIERSELKIK